MKLSPLMAFSVIGVSWGFLCGMPGHAEEPSFKLGIDRVIQESSEHADEVFVVQVGAEWCESCHALDKRLAGSEYEFLKKNRRRLLVNDDNDDLHRDLVLELGIRPPSGGYPFLISIQNGKPVGYLSKAKSLTDPKSLKLLLEGKTKNIAPHLAMARDIERAKKSNSLDVSAEELKSGEFKDDQFPLPWSKDLTTAQMPAPPAACAADPASGQAEAPWTVGYREALAGQRFVLSSQDLERGKSTSTQNPSRRACLAQRAPGRETQLACCLAGFSKGVPLLKQKIQALAEGLKNDFPKTPPSQHEVLCAHDYAAGQNMARNQCANSKRLACATDQTGAIEGGIRYLGCYSLGFQVSFANCNNADGRRVQEYLVRNWPGVYESTSKLKPNRDSFQLDSEPNSSSAGSARDI